MSPFIAELLGTSLLMLIGTGVNANVTLHGTKGNGSGWIVMTAGWGMAVFVAVACVGDESGAHINPAVTLGLALAGQFAWDHVPAYILAQLLGAFVGTTAAVLTYFPHYKKTQDPRAVLGSLSTIPQVRHYGWNTLTEAIGTFVLLIAVLHFAQAHAQPGNGETIHIGLGSVGAVPVGLLVFAIGMGLGGPTGYAINPARDLCPRIIHTLLPLSNKGSSDWPYSWVPIVGPILGAAAAAGVHMLITN